MSRVTHFEIHADNIEKMIEFYERTFGWKFLKWEGPMEYWMIMTGPEEVGIDGGLARKGENFIPVNMIDSTDIDEDIRKIRESGGEIIKEKMEVPEVGYIAYFKDPEGNAFGLVQDASPK